MANKTYTLKATLVSSGNTTANICINLNNHYNQTANISIPITAIAIEPVSMYFFARDNIADYATKTMLSSEDQALLDISANGNTSSYANAFSGCEALQSIDMSKFDLSNTIMSQACFLSAKHSCRSICRHSTLPA